MSPVPYANNQPRLLKFKFFHDRFEIEVDNKPTFASTCKPGKEFRLRFHGGDARSPGVAEFTGFRVDPIDSPASAQANPAQPSPAPAYTPPPGSNIFTDGPAPGPRPAVGKTPTGIGAKKNILLFVGNTKEEALFRAVPGANVRVVKPAETAAILARPDTIGGANIVVWGRNTFPDMTEAVFTPAVWDSMLRLMQAGGDVVIFEQAGGNPERGLRIKAHWQFIEKDTGAKFRGGPFKMARAANADLAARFQAAGLGEEFLSKVIFYNGYTPPANATVLVNSRAEYDVPVVVGIPVGKGRLILIGTNLDAADEPLDKAVFDFIYRGHGLSSAAPAPPTAPAFAGGAPGAKNVVLFRSHRDFEEPDSGIKK